MLASCTAYSAVGPPFDADLVCNRNQEEGEKSLDISD